METETTQQHDKVEQERKRKAGNSKAYRKRKKRLNDQSNTQKSENSTTTKIFAEPKRNQSSAANLKAWREKKIGKVCGRGGSNTPKSKVIRIIVRNN